MAGKRKLEASKANEALDNATDDSAANGLIAKILRPTAAQKDPEPMQQMIKWEVDVSDLDNRGKDSPTVTINGIKWYVRARTENSDRTQNEPNLSLYVYHSETNRLKVWYADVLISMRVINLRDKEKDKVEDFSYRFNYTLNNCGYAKFLKMSDVLSPFQGFNNKNMVTTEVSITVIKVYGFDPSPTFHNFFVPTDHSNGCILVDRTPLYVSKQFLAINSPVFENLFFQGSRKTNLNKIELEDVVCEEFIELLHVLYTPERKINPNNCEFLLKLSDRFQIKSVAKRVEHFLCTSYQFPHFTIAAKLKLADEYKLYEAQHANLLRLRKVSEIKSLKTQHEYVHLSDALKLMINDLQLTLQSKK